MTWLKRIGSFGRLRSLQHGGKTYFYQRGFFRFPAHHFRSLVLEEDTPEAFYWDDLEIKLSSKHEIVSQRIVRPIDSPFFLKNSNFYGSGLVCHGVLLKLKEEKVIKNFRQVDLALKHLIAQKRVRILEEIARVDFYPFKKSRWRIPAVSKKAMLSLIVCYRDRWELTKRLLESTLKQKTKNKSIEVLLVDNRSDESTKRKVKDYLDANPNLRTRTRVLSYPFEFNHSAQCNFAVKESVGEVLFMLNNDCVLLTENCLEEMANLSLEPGVGGVCPMVVGESQRLVASGVQIFKDKVTEKFGIRENEQDYFPNCDRETAGVPFAVAAISRKCWDLVGGLDEVTYPTQYNDADFCMRALRLGLRHFVKSDCVAFHEPGQTELRDREISLQRLRQFADRNEDLQNFNRREAYSKRFKGVVDLPLYFHCWINWMFLPKILLRQIRRRTNVLSGFNFIIVRAKAFFALFRSASNAPKDSGRE